MTRSRDLRHAEAQVEAIREALRRGAPPDGVVIVRSRRGRPVAVAWAAPPGMGGAFGLSGPGADPVVLLRLGLHPRIERTVLAHELNHVDDFADDPAPRHWIVREWRATAPLLRSDPIGVARTVWATVTDRERRQFYRDRVRRGS